MFPNSLKITLGGFLLFVITVLWWGYLALDAKTTAKLNEFQELRTSVQLETDPDKKKELTSKKKEKENEYKEASSGAGTLYIFALVVTIVSAGTGFFLLGVDHHITTHNMQVRIDALERQLAR